MSGFPGIELRDWGGVLVAEEDKSSADEGKQDSDLLSVHLTDYEHILTERYLSSSTRQVGFYIIMTLTEKFKCAEKLHFQYFHSNLHI